MPKDSTQQRPSKYRSRGKPSALVEAAAAQAIAEITKDLRRLNPTQRAFLRLRPLLATDQETIRQLGISPSTFYGWKLDKNFKEVYDKLWEAPLEVAYQHLVDVAGLAGGVFEEVLTAKGEDGAPKYDVKVRLDVAKFIFGQIYGSRQVVERRDIPASGVPAEAKVYKRAVERGELTINDVPDEYREYIEGEFRHVEE